MANLTAGISTLVSALALLGWVQGGTGIRLEDAERAVGPLEIGDRRFTVVMHNKRVPGSGDPDLGDTLAGLEIRSVEGTVQYRHTFPYEVVGDRFAESVSATIQVLKGKQGSGMLVTYATLPSAPLGGTSWQVFGLFSGPPSSPMNGRVVPFSKPIFTQGQMINGTPGAAVVHTSQEPKLQGDVLHFRVWGGNFFVIVPLRILWFRNTIEPGWRCSKMTSAGRRAVCGYPVQADRRPLDEDLTFVRLHAEAEEGFGIPAHVVVKRDSNVAFLEAEVEVRWQEGTNAIEMSIGADPWLKVRIDGKEGWIHTQEDFVAIGLLPAG